MTEIVGTSKKEIVQSFKNNFSDFEDSIQYSSAMTIKGLDAIITRNIKDYKHSNIAVMTPLNFLNLREQNQNYYFERTKINYIKKHNSFTQCKILK